MSLSLTFSLIFFTAFAVYSLLALHVLFLDLKSRTNILFFILCVLLAIWTFSFSIANSAPDHDMASLWHRLSVIGWGPISAVLLHFVLVLTGNSQRLKSKWLYLLIYLPGAVTVFVFGLYGETAAGHFNLINTAAGWIYIPPHNIWDWFFNVYYGSFALISLWLLRNWGKKSKDAVKIIQARLISICLAADLIMAVFLDILSIGSRHYDLPQMGSVALLLPVPVFIYLINRYNLMNPKHDPAADAEVSSVESDMGVFYQIISMTFLLCSFLNFFSHYFISQAPLLSVLLFSLFLFSYGVIFQIVNLFPPQARIERFIFVVLLSVSIPVICFRFINDASMTTWILPFIFLILAVINRKSILIWFGALILITQILVWIKAPHAIVYLDTSDHIARLGFLAIAFWLVYYLNRLYMNRFKESKAQIKFQQLISQVSKEFVKAADFNLDETIHEVLALSGRYFMADRAWFVRLPPQLKVLEWVSGDTPSAADIILDLKTEDFPWFTSAFDNNEVVHLPDTKMIPSEYTKEKAFVEQLGVRSILAIKVVSKDRLFGYLFYDSLKKYVSWPKDNQEMIKILANLLSDALVKSEAEKEITYMAFYDNLTGLPNRSTFKQGLHKDIISTGKSGKMLAVMFLDLDSFKSINDTMGHDIGDEVLRILALRLSSNLRSTDRIARFGGDEFLIQINQIGREEDITNVADRIMKTFADPLHLNGQELFITASAGISVYPVDGRDADELIKNADLAMYASKYRGKNRYTLCSPFMKEDVKQQM